MCADPTVEIDGEMAREFISLPFFQRTSYYLSLTFKLLDSRVELRVPR